MGVNDTMIPWQVGDYDDLLQRPITLVASQGALAKGTVLGKIKIGAAVGAKVAGGAGGGNISAVSAGKDAKVGVYTLTCIAKATGLGTFQVNDPQSNLMVPVTAAVGGTPYVSTQINFTLTSAGSDFEVGDKFTVTVAAGSGQYQTALSAATDGSADACAVLPVAVTVTSAVTMDAIVAGTVYENNLVFGTGSTAANTRASLWANNIFPVLQK